MPGFLDHQKLLEFDKTKASGFRFVFGVDEAGRGPLAGPVVAAAVLIDDMDFSSRIGDSKALSEKQRERAFEEILRRAFVGVGVVDHQKIDEINILRASHLAMSLAVHDLAQKKSFLPQDVKVLVDGNCFKGDISYHVECVVKGDSKSFAIACASIVAKVTRDKMMLDFDQVYPQYGFARHKGYPTQAHRDAIKQFGLSAIHRKTFSAI